MSHFTVLVIGDNPEKQLAPYHEFESTDVDDKYVVDVDKTEEYLTRYAEESSTRLKAPDGTLHTPWSDEFYREFTPAEEKELGPLRLMGSGFGHGISWSSRVWGDGKGYRPKVRVIPEGYEEVKVPCSELMSFVEYVINDGIEPVKHGAQPDLTGPHKYGYVLLDKNNEVLKIIKRTNPNAKWDWYVLGGRWTGFFKLKAGTAGQVGSPGIMTKLPLCGTADQARKGDIDFARMRRNAEKKAAREYDAVRAAIDPHLPVQTWDEVREKHSPNIDTAREEFGKQPAIIAFYEIVKQDFFTNIDPYLVDRETFVQRKGTGSYMTFAVIKDGKWYERGNMGWWGVVSDKKDDDVWLNEFAKLIDNLPDNVLLSVYDCHI